MDDLKALELALARERAARSAAEALLEHKSAELYLANQQLEAAKLGLEQRVEHADVQNRINLTHLKLAMKAISAGTLIWNQTEDRVQMDEAICALMGVGNDVAPLRMNDWLALLQPANRRIVTAAMAAAAARWGEVDCELRPGGSDRILHLNGRFLAPHGGEELLLAMVTDVTRRRHQQLDRRRLATARERRERLAIMGELASTIAHEINQPLGSICNYAAAAKRLQASAPDSPDLRRALEQIESLSMHASTTIKELRSVLSESHAITEPTRTALIVDRAVESAEAAARDAGVHIDREVVDTEFQGSALLLERAVSNLIRNAIEAIDDARVKGTVTVRAVPEDGWVVFQVDDEGPGLGGMDSEEVFEPLVTSRAAGSGMGLALCRTVAEQHAGTIRCIPNPRHPTGLRFELRIPGSS